METEKINDIIRHIKSGGIGVIPTDTVYGLVADASQLALIEKIYDVTGRPADKPFIVLISSSDQLKLLGITLSQKQTDALRNIWPGPVSAVLPCPRPDMEYLHRGKKSLAVRLPDSEWLREIIETCGPIIATSANRSGLSTPSELSEIETQLPGLDFYVTGETATEPSKLVVVEEDGSLRWLSRSQKT